MVDQFTFLERVVIMRRIFILSVAFVVLFGQLLIPSIAESRCKLFCMKSRRVSCYPGQVHDMSCAIYPIMQGENTTYYALQYHYDDVAHTCQYVGPVALYGQYSYPMTCPNCQQKEHLGSLADPPGYPRPIKDEDFDPASAVPDIPGVSRPNSSDPRKIRFLDDSNNEVFTVVHSISVNPRLICRRTGGRDCRQHPNHLVIKIGYQVDPPDVNKPQYTRYDNATRVGTKSFRIPLVAAPSAPEDFALVLLVED